MEKTNVFTRLFSQVAENTGYDEDKAPLTAADAQITVTEKNNATAVSAGKSLQFSAAFGNPDRINKANKNNDIFWTVLKADGAMCMDEAGITDKGQLIAGKTVTEPVELVVKAVSNTYRTSGEYRVTVIPEVTNISAEPGELFFYVGTDTEQTVQVRLEPESVPPVGLTWEARGKGIIEITDSGDGSAAIRPLKAGKDTVTVKEPGGKSTKINVVVGEPVTALELSCKGKAKPGGTVTVAAKLTPANPANKNVEWSIDVGEDVATINEKGQLKIGKDAAAGTVITVTCTAPGAPEPITETLQITVQPYAEPRLTEVTVFRCDSMGDPADDGQYYSAKGKGLYSSLSGQNSMTMTVAHKRTEDAAFGTEVTLQNDTAMVIGTISADSSYQVRLTVTDALGKTASVTVALATQHWAMKFRPGGMGVGFGKAPEHDNCIELPTGWVIRIGSTIVVSE